MQHIIPCTCQVAPKWEVKSFKGVVSLSYPSSFSHFFFLICREYGNLCSNIQYPNYNTKQFYLMSSLLLYRISWKTHTPYNWNADTNRQITLTSDGRDCDPVWHKGSGDRSSSASSLLFASLPPAHWNIYTPLLWECIENLQLKIILHIYRGSCTRFLHMRIWWCKH